MRHRMTAGLKKALVSCCLMILFACGCSTREISSSASTGAVYTDPSGDGWRIIKEASGTTANNIVLKLVGPSGVKARGVALTIRHQGDGLKVAWIKNSSGAYATHDDVFKLYNVDQTEPQAFMADVQGTALIVGAFQKGKTNPPVDVGRDIFHFQIQVQAGLIKGTEIPLEVVKAQIYPETPDLKKNARLTPINIVVGKLTAE